MKQPLDRLEKQLLLAATLILAIGHFIHLGTQPLYLEEPRRAIITMELLENGNLLVPTLLGDYYYNKPPLFNWVLLSFAWLAGGFQEGALRLPTVLSLLAWSGLIFFFGRRSIGLRFGWYSALLTLSCGAFLYYFSLIAEIDLFYSLITFTAIMALFYGYQRQQWLATFMTVYGLSALGFLTKGLPSIAFAGISIVAWLVYQRDWKRLLSWQHILGGFFFLIIVGAYYAAYGTLHDPYPALERLWSESSNRTVVGDSGPASFVVHLITFPLNFWANLLPAAGLLVFFLFSPERQKAWATLHKKPFLLFCLLMLGANILLYWLSPGTRLRYVYPLFPFAIYVLVWFWLQPGRPRHWPAAVFRACAGLLIHLLALTALAILWVPDLDFLPYRTLLAIAFFLLLAGCAWFFWRKPPPALERTRYTMLILLISIGLSRWLFAFTVLPQRAQAGGAYNNQQRAECIHELTQNASLHTVGSDKVIAYTSIFYLNRLREKTVRRQDTLIPNQYYLITRDSAWHPAADTLLEYRYNDLEQYLIFLPD